MVGAYGSALQWTINKMDGAGMYGVQMTLQRLKRQKNALNMTYGDEAKLHALLTLCHNEMT